MEEILKNIAEQKWKIPIEQDLSILKTPVKLKYKTIPNRIAIQPMEGCDGTADGMFSDLTRRRYQRFANSGAGLIWFEAVAIVQEGRANPRQLWINPNTVEHFKREVEAIRQAAKKQHGIEPILIMQATHSGRYSKPNGVPEPMIALNKPVFEKTEPLPERCIVTDTYLERLEEMYGKAAMLAQQAGFDGIDIKCCHGYLLSELMSAFNREGKYGGSFENRTRLYFNAVENANQATAKDFIVTSRMNVYDGFAYPFGFGVHANGGLQPDLTEPLQVIDRLHNQYGMEMIDITIGNPYVNPHVNRPFNQGPYPSPEQPLAGVERMMQCVGTVQKTFEKLAVVGSGFSYLKDAGASVAAGAVKTGICSIAGFGRQAFAYPAFAEDIFQKGQMDAKKCCIACGKCSALMRAGTVAGCVIRDSEVYLPYYRQYCMK